MKPPQIKAVLFDLGNVLLCFNALKAARQFAKNCDVSLTRVWIHFFTSQVERAYTRGEISTYAFYRHACKALKKKISYGVFRHYWNDIFWENKGMEDLLKKLKKKYPLYLISNTNAMHFNHVRRQFTMLRHFKKTFPSHEMGHRKPEAAIYQKVLRRIKLPAEQTVFIDDVPAFVNGARKAGMHAIRFRNRKQLIRDFKKFGIKV